MKTTKTYSAKPSDVIRKWYVIDASEASLGRISTVIATRLMGKQKPMFTPHIDCGDFVVVINAKNLIVTGKKQNDKIYYSHSGFPGGISQKTLAEKLAESPESIIISSVRGMMPSNKLRPNWLARLKVYPDDSHNHNAQTPEKISLKGSK